MQIRSQGDRYRSDMHFLSPDPDADCEEKPPEDNRKTSGFNFLLCQTNFA